jgi:hypothetical protein
MNAVASDVEKPLNKNLELVRVTNIGCSNLYRAEVTMPDGTLKVFDPVRAYSDLILVDDNPVIQLHAKCRSIKNLTVKYPYHYFHVSPSDDVVLCAMKRFKLEKDNSLALNYELFLTNVWWEWKTCIILHMVNGVPFVFFSGRDVWLKEGKVGIEEREIQIFLNMERHQDVPLSLAAMVMDKPVVEWANRCVDEFRRKGDFNR